MFSVGLGARCAELEQQRNVFITTQVSWFVSVPGGPASRMAGRMNGPPGGPFNPLGDLPPTDPNAPPWGIRLRPSNGLGARHNNTLQDLPE